MDSFEINKIVAAVLMVALLVIGIGKLSNVIFHVEKPKTPGYAVKVEAATTVSTSSSSSASDFSCLATCLFFVLRLLVSLLLPVETVMYQILRFLYNVAITPPNYDCFCYIYTCIGFTTEGESPALGAGGREFESLHPDTLKPYFSRRSRAFVF